MDYMYSVLYYAHAVLVAHTGITVYTSNSSYFSVMASEDNPTLIDSETLQDKMP